MSFEMIKIDQVDRVAIVTLNRPEVLNALSLQLVRELDEFVTETEQDDNIGAIVITGAAVSTTFTVRTTATAALPSASLTL